MKYPHVITETRTLALLHDGHSIARFGDGELRLAIGKECTSQRRVPGLAEELRAMLKAPRNCLVGIPNFAQTPKAENWTRYAGEQFTKLYGAKEYASSFITRPDSAPWIDTPEYWADVRRLWYGRDVILVRGDEKSITPAMLDGTAASVRIVDGPRQHAYASIAEIEALTLAAAGEIMRDRRQASPLVILCLGATATALAWRLAHKPGLQALDLGHIGMFMRHAGAYRYLAADLVSPGYREQLAQLHAGTRKWGTDGAKHAAKVLQLADELARKRSSTMAAARAGWPRRSRRCGCRVTIPASQSAPACRSRAISSSAPTCWSTSSRIGCRRCSIISAAWPARPLTW
jgi:hypothetical protein